MLVRIEWEKKVTIKVWFFLEFRVWVDYCCAINWRRSKIRDWIKDVGSSCLALCCAACACDACRTVVSGISRRSSRIAYCGLFSLSLIVSWILREAAAPLMEKIPCKLLFFPITVNEFFSPPFVRKLFWLHLLIDRSLPLWFRYCGTFGYAY